MSLPSPSESYLPFFFPRSFEFDPSKIDSTRIILNRIESNQRNQSKASSIQLAVIVSSRDGITPTQYNIIRHNITSYGITDIESYGIISHHTALRTSHHTVLYHVIRYHFTSYGIISHHAELQTSHHTVLYHIIRCHVTSYGIISHHTVSYRIMQNYGHRIIRYYITSYGIISHHAELRTSHHTVSCHWDGMREMESST